MKYQRPFTYYMGLVTLEFLQIDVKLGNKERHITSIYLCSEKLEVANENEEINV